MDYFDILKKAWNITWRYKMLWVLGFFAASGSSGSNGGGGNSGYSGNTGSGDMSGFRDAFASAERWLYDNVVLVAVIVGVLVVIGLAFFLLSIAAQAGLVWGGNEGAEGRTPSLRRAWGVGFSMWGRVFMIGFMLGLPIFLIAMVVAVLTIASIGGAGLADNPTAAIGAFGGGMCCFLPLITLALIAIGVVVGIVYPLALRYAVLQNVTFGQAIMRGWEDLRGKRGAFVFFLVMLLPGIAFSFASVIFVLPFAVIMFPLLLAGKFVAVIAVAVLMVLVLMLPSAVYNTFASAAWTVFFRRMTGMEPAVGIYPSTGPTYVEPPAPPAAPQAPTYAPVQPPIVDAAPPAPTPAPAPAPAPEPASAPAPEPASAPAPTPAPQAEALPDDFWVPAPSDAPAAPEPPAPPQPPVPPADE